MIPSTLQSGAPPARPLRFGLVGWGWRTRHFRQVALALPEQFELIGCLRAHPRGDEGVPVWADWDALVAARPDCIVTSVPREHNPEFILRAQRAGIPVLAETPPAQTLADLHALWAEYDPQGSPVQVAEQWPLLPLHAARQAVAESGKLGDVRQAQVSAAHGYHGVALLRGLMGVARGVPVTIEARRFAQPLVAGPGRSGPPKQEELIASSQVIAQLRWADERLGIFDFMREQYFASVHAPRVMVRGSHGEITGDEVRWLADFRTPLYARLERQDAGRSDSLDGPHHQGYLLGAAWIYRNPFAPARLSDDEIAVAGCLARLARVIRGEEQGYDLAEGCHDHYLSLLLDEAAESGQPISSTPQPWNGDSVAS